MRELKTKADFEKNNLQVFDFELNFNIDK